MGQSPDGSTYSDEPSDYILVQGNADLQNGWVCPRIWTTQITKKADAGDLIMSVRAPAGAMGKTAYNAVIGRGVAAIKGNEFIYQLLVKMDADGFWKTLSCGSTFESLNSDNIKNAEVKIPTTAEQIKIGGYFQQLDNLITLHQRKCVFLFGFFQAFISMIFTASTFSWEQRKVQDVADRFDNLRIPVAANLRVHGTTPYYGANGIQDYVEGFTHDGEFVLVAEDGANDLKNYPVKCVNGRIWVNNHAHVLQGKAGISDNSFLAFAISQSDIESLLVGGSRAKLNAETLMSIEFKLPCLQEQYRIGEYLTQLDHLITLHQRECISFTARAGRFILTANKKRNTSSWEQRKLSEMCGTFEYGLNAAAKEFDGKNKYIRITDIDDASREFLLSDLSSPDICLDGMSRYLLSSGDIVFARTGASVGKTYIYRENDGIVYFAGFLIRAKVNQDNDAEFVFQSTLSPSYEKYIRITSQRSGQPGVNAQEYGEYDLFAPSKEEQQRIGHFLRGIDNLITLHQRKPFLMKWRTSDANRNQTNRLVL